jgi:hypothetical protein
MLSWATENFYFVISFSSLHFKNIKTILSLLAKKKKKGHKTDLAHKL